MNEAARDEAMEDLRKALQLAVCKIIFDEDREQGTRTNQKSIAALTELTFQYATKSLIPDLYTYSTHANRKSTISPDDVAVALRKIQPDQLEAFKRSFCRSGSKSVSSKNNAPTTSIGSVENMKREATRAGRRRRRNDTEILSLSSSSSSSDNDCESVYGSKADRNKKSASDVIKLNFGKRSRGGVVLATSASTSTSATRRSCVKNLSLPTKPIAIGRKSNRSESLLNKFQLNADRNESDCSNDRFEYDSSSTNDDDITRPSIGMTKTARSRAATESTSGKKCKVSRKVSLQGKHGRENRQQQNQKILTSSTHIKNSRLQDNDDDSTDEDDFFLGRNAPDTKKCFDTKKNKANSPTRYSKSNRNESCGLEDDDVLGDDHSDTMGNQHGHRRKVDDEDIDRAASKQSQVAEALANLSSDSGMDEDDNEDEIRMNARKVTLKSRHRPFIESDDDA